MPLLLNCIHYENVNKSQVNVNVEFEQNTLHLAFSKSVRPNVVIKILYITLFVDSQTNFVTLA